MSEIEHYVGTLIPTGKTLAEFDPSAEDISDLEERAVEIDGLIYTVSRSEPSPCRFIYKSTKNPDGAIDFEVRYYNGWGSFEEAIDEALKN